VGAAGGAVKKGNQAWVSGRMQGGGTQSGALLLLLEVLVAVLVPASGNGQIPPGK